MIVLLVCLFTMGCDTVYVATKTDAKYLAYQDSLTAYNTGKSVCDSLVVLFNSYEENQNYTRYFTLAWTTDLKNNAEIDSTLGSSEFKLYNDYPDTGQGNIFSSQGVFGQRVANQLRRLNNLKVKPYGVVSGAELPTVYIYRKPHIRVLLKKRMSYTTLDTQTYFILDNLGKTKRPYNIRRFYENDKYVKEEWVDPISDTVISK